MAQGCRLLRDAGLHTAQDALRRHLTERVPGRYGRPLMISETGAVGVNRQGWLQHVGGEVRMALRRGVPVEEPYLYPIMDHPGWDGRSSLPGWPDPTGCRVTVAFGWRRHAPGLQEEAMLPRPLLAETPRLVADLAAD